MFYRYKIVHLLVGRELSKRICFENWSESMKYEICDDLLFHFAQCISIEIVIYSLRIHYRWRFRLDTFVLDLTFISWQQIRILIENLRGFSLMLLNCVYATRTATKKKHVYVSDVMWMKLCSRYEQQAKRSTQNGRKWVKMRTIFYLQRVCICLECLKLGSISSCVHTKSWFCEQHFFFCLKAWLVRTAFLTYP